MNTPSFNLVQEPTTISLPHSQFSLLNTFGCIGISGDNAAKFLQGQLTCDIQKVNESSAVLSSYCNPQGRVIASFYVTKRNGDYFLILPKGMMELVQKKLAKFAVFSKVAVKIENEISCFGFFIEKSQEEATFKKFLEAGIFLAKCHSQCYLTLVLQDQVTQMGSLFSILNFVIHDETVWKKLHIQKGISFIYPETSEIVTPHMINYPALGAVDFNKGCYVGQEIIARTHYLGKTKRKLYWGTLYSEQCPKEGDKLFQGEQEIGIIMEAVTTQENEQQMLAVIQDNVDLAAIGVITPTCLPAKEKHS